MVRPSPRPSSPAPLAPPGPARRGRLRAVGAAAAIAATGAALAPTAATAASTPRPLVHVLVLDGFDGERLDTGGAPFLRSLVDGQGGRARYYREARAIMVAETNPNHTAMLTGDYADRSGVPGNAFALYRRIAGEEDGEAERCTATGPEDLTSLPTVTSGEHADCIRSESIFQAIDRQGDPDDLVTSGIYGKSKLGNLYAQRKASGAFHADHLWTPCSRDPTPTEREFCRNVPVEPVSGDRAASDAVVMDEVIRTIDEGVGPDRKRPDFTYANLPVVDTTGHIFGAGKPTYDQALAAADAQVRRLVDRLKARGEWERSLLVVVSDHGHDDTPQSSTITRSFTSAGISQDDFVVVQNGNLDMVYLKDRASPSRFALLRRMRAAANATPNVDRALFREPNPQDGGTTHTMDGRHPNWRMAGERTGDLVVFGQPGMRFSDPQPTSNPLQGNHGNWHTLNQLFVVAGGGAAVRGGAVSGTQGPRLDDTAQNPGQAENVDVASTVQGAFGLFPTLENRGRFLADALDPAALPGGGVPRVRVGLKVQAQRRTGTRRRYRFAWGIEGGTWDMELERRSPVTRRLMFRRVYTGMRMRSKRSRLLPGRGYRVRVRAVSAAGVPGAWETVRFTARG